MPMYECSNCYNEFSEQLYPVNISDVKWVKFICDKYPNGCIQISCHDAQENAYYATRLLKCYVSKKGRYAIWGKHRFYEGYSGCKTIRNDSRIELEKVKWRLYKLYGNFFGNNSRDIDWLHAVDDSYRDKT